MWFIANKKMSICEYEVIEIHIVLFNPRLVKDSDLADDR
jgi:hypothetical protein